MNDWFLAALREFWVAGVPRVSAGALGMHVRGMPFDDREVTHLAKTTPGVKWKRGWMVQA